MNHIYMGSLKVVYGGYQDIISDIIPWISTTNKPPYL